MGNFKLIKTAAALALGASVVTSAVATTDASAASKYKIKSGKLVYAKSGKVVKGYVTYKSTVYKNGKKLTGLKGKTYYKAGKKATGTYKGVYYVKGVKKVTTGTYNKAYYVKGVKKVSTGLYASKYYKDGKVATGTYKGAYYVNGVKKVTTGTYNGAYYVKGKKVVSTGLYADKLYVAGKLNKGYKLYNENLYKDAVLNTELALFEGKLYDGAKQNDKLVIFDGKLYDGVKVNEGIKEFDGKWYNDAELANGTFTIEGKEVAIEKGIEVGAKVASVEAVNGTTFVVKFNKAVDKKSAEAATVKVGATSLTAGKLSEDGRTLTFTTEDAIEAKDATVEVPAIVTKADEKVSTPKYVTVLNYKDTVAPVIASASSAIATIDATTTNKVTVKFSETVQTAGIAYVNGEAATVSQGTNKDELILTFTKALKAGEAVEVKLTNVKDIAGNTIDPNPATVTTQVVAADAVAPVVTNVTTKGLTVTVAYDKEVTNQVIDAAKTYVSANGTKVASLTYSSISEDKKSVTYTVEFGSDTAGVAAKAAYDKDHTFTGMLYAQEGLVLDNAKNKSAAFTQSVKFEADTTAPTLVSSEFKEGKLVLSYDEEVVLGASAKVTYFEKNASTGYIGSTEEIDLSSKAVIDGKTVTVTVPALDAEKTYEFNAAKGTFKDAANNEVAAFTKTITTPKEEVVEAEDKVAPAITAEQGNAGAYTLTYTVTDALNNLDFASILDVANYTFAGKALPSGTKITTDATGAAKTANVTVTLPKSAFAKDAKGVFTITGIKDIKGNAVKEIVTTAEVTFKDAVAPELTAAKINADGTITMTLSEELATALVDGDVKVTATKGGTPTVIAGAVAAGKGADAGKYVFTANTQAADILAADSVVVETVEVTTGADAATNKVVGGTKITATK
ncbi:Ig-like domain-containing protein [Kurthia sp. ISK08]|uniref:Ig-like domain-containing protein n=1 Tax=Kurthia sp. ISK08 TaxID=3385835 RepID=UPI0038FC068C